MPRRIMGKECKFVLRTHIKHTIIITKGNENLMVQIEGDLLDEGKIDLTIEDIPKNKIGKELSELGYVLGCAKTDPEMWDEHDTPWRCISILELIDNDFEVKLFKN